MDWSVDWSSYGSAHEYGAISFANAGYFRTADGLVKRGVAKFTNPKCLRFMDVS